MMGKVDSAVDVCVRRRDSGLEFSVKLVRIPGGAKPPPAAPREPEQPTLSVSTPPPKPVVTTATTPSPSSSRGSSKAGLGITFKKDRSGRYAIKRIVEGGPASASGGVREGDILVAIGGVEVSELSQHELARLILGPENSNVKIQVGMEGEIGWANDIRVLCVRCKVRMMGRCELLSW